MKFTFTNSANGQYCIPETRTLILARQAVFRNLIEKKTIHDIYCLFEYEAAIHKNIGMFSLSFLTRLYY
jgi:hypothetical protein